MKQRDLHDNGRNTIKGGSQETKEQKCMGGRRTGYGKREIVTPLSPPTGEDYVTKQTSVQRGYWLYFNRSKCIKEAV